MQPTICEIAVPRADRVDPSWLMQQSDALGLARAVEALGAPDFFSPLASSMHDFRDQSDRLQLQLAAVTGVSDLPTGDHGLPLLSWEAELCGPAGVVVGLATVGASTRENPAVAELDVHVDQGFRRRGVGRRLLDAAETVARGWGRTTFQAWSDHASPEACAESVVPATGFGAIGRDAAARFCQAAGYRLEQCERHSTCALPTDEAVLAPLWQQAVRHSGDYQVVTVLDELPDELVDSYAALVRHFSVEVPSGALDNEASDMDAERIRRGEARRRAMGRHSVTTMALHRTTGDVVAATRIDTDAEHPEVCFQEITVVDREHRGHRLGMLVKVANHRAVAQHHAGRRRIHTWNADENQHMLAINHALGFRAQLVEGAWQKRV